MTAGPADSFARAWDRIILDGSSAPWRFVTIRKCINIYHLIIK